MAPHTDGMTVERLMAKSTDALVKTLQRLSKPALQRLLESGGEATEFFNEEEEAQLAQSLAGVWGTANLFGRARIQLRAAEATRLQGKGPTRFSDESTSFACFGDEPLPPLKPLEALKYFLRLVPSLNIDPLRFGAMLERHAFTLAVATNERMLDRVQEVIGNQFETGEATGYGQTGTAGRINAILTEAGITPKNPQYCEMVARTNTMDGLTTGSQREQYRLRDTFPAWKYSAITKDRRGRKWHIAKNGMIFSIELPFAKVRGEDIGDAANCRCVPIPVDKWDLQKFLDGGGELATTWPVREDYQ